MMVCKLVQNTSTVARYMSEADLAVTSGGRTVFELASLHVPTMVIAQNDREATHSFVRNSPSVVYCGQMGQISKDSFVNTFRQLVEGDLLREKMRQFLAEVDLRRGTDRVLEIIRMAITASEQKKPCR